MKILRFFDKILTTLFWFLFILSFDSPKFAFLTVLAAIIHERGHLFALQTVTKKYISFPSASVFGLRIKLPEGASYKDELICAAAGPLANLLVSIPFAFIDQGTALTFATVNFFTAISNLVPILNSDGYRIIRCILSIRLKSCEAPDAVCFWIAFCVSSALALAALLIILMIGEGYWAFLLFFSSFIITIQNQRNL